MSPPSKWSFWASSSETRCSSAAFCVCRVDTSCACTGPTGRLRAPTSWPALVLWQCRTPRTKIDRSDLAPGKACCISWVVVLKVVNCSWTMDWISANLMHAWYRPSFGFSPEEVQQEAGPDVIWRPADAAWLHSFRVWTSHCLYLGLYLETMLTFTYACTSGVQCIVC